MAIFRLLNTFLKSQSIKIKENLCVEWPRQHINPAHPLSEGQTDACPGSHSQNPEADSWAEPQTQLTEVQTSYGNVHTGNSQLVEIQNSSQ